MSLIKSQIGEGELSGSLLKLGAINKTWKSRWFVLQGDKLYYFKTKDSPKAITFISVLHAHVRVSPEYFPNDYCFELVTDKRIFQLVAPSYMKMLQWMQAIKKYSTVVHENRLIEHAEEDIIAAQRTFSEAEDNNNNDNDNNNNNNNSDGSLGFHGHESEDDDEFIEDFSNAKAMHLNSFVGSPGDLSDSDLDFNMAGSSPGIGSDCISSSPSSLGSSPGEYVSSSPNSDGTGNGGSDNTIVGSSSSSTSAIQSSNSNGSRTVYICRSSPLTVTSSSSSRGVTTITTTTTTTTTRITTITRTTKTITTAASGIEEQCTPPLGPPSLMLGPSASSSPTFTDEADNG